MPKQRGNFGATTLGRRAIPGTRRRKLTHTRIGLSHAALYHWQRGDLHACHQALGIMPWQWSPFDVDGPEPPEWVLKERNGGVDGIGMSTESWDRAWELRQALIELAGEPGPFDRHGQPLGAVLPDQARWR
jgi:hypothetical protein